MQEFEALFEEVEFVVIAVVVLLLAYLALEHREIVYSVFFFGFMAASVAGFYLLLEAPFIAGMQIAVYTGGISALIIFGVLLLPRAQGSSLEVLQTPRMRRIGMILSATVMTLSAVLALVFPWSQSFPADRPPIAQDLAGLAAWLWGEHGIYVQLVALMMLTAVIGSVAILKMEKTEKLSPLKDRPGLGSRGKENEGASETKAHDEEHQDAKEAGTQ